MRTTLWEKKNWQRIIKDCKIGCRNFNEKKIRVTQQMLDYFKKANLKANLKNIMH